MTYDKVRGYAVNAISTILPLENETCKEVVNYTLTLGSDQEINDHLLDLLGHTEESYRFIMRFMELKHEEDQVTKPPTKKSPSPAILDKEQKKQAWSLEPAPKQQTSKQRLSGNRESTTISQLAESKPSNKLSSHQAKKSKKKNLDNLKDIEAALNDLEVEKTESLGWEDLTLRRSCNCMATRHPLFEVAPNCLNCGKIICSKEGLQPCSYCGNELLSTREKVEIVKILQSERDLLETKNSNPNNKQVQDQESRLKPKGKKIKVSMTAGENLWKAQDEAFRQMEEEKKRMHEIEEKELEKKKELDDQLKELEHYEREKNSNPDLIKAQERLETLLNFQETGAERTRIIDNASDFDMPHQSSGSMWLSPVERALQLKKQQKQLRKIEEQEKVRTGRAKKVVEMVIKDGKVAMVEKHVYTQEVPKEENEIEELQGVLKQEKLDQDIAMSKNTWDYTKEHDKWEKPVYISQETTSQSNNFSAPLVQRVQFDQTDSTELVAAMPS